MNARTKEPPLIIEARPPGQDAANVESFPIDLEKHIFRADTFGRTGVMRATRSVNMMIAAVESVVHWIDPTLQLHLQVGRRARSNRDLSPKRSILRPARVLHGQMARS